MGRKGAEERERQGGEDAVHACRRALISPLPLTESAPVGYSVHKGAEGGWLRNTTLVGTHVHPGNTHVQSGVHK